ncbi:MAG TPA: hypothetical protein PKA38_00920 [Candidatus Levybacteria bacterium]|nr:hypothetical protein [Candidatus Levybacteria bacterium]
MSIIEAATSIFEDKIQRTAAREMNMRYKKGEELILDTARDARWIVSESGFSDILMVQDSLRAFVDIGIRKRDLQIADDTRLAFLNIPSPMVQKAILRGACREAILFWDEKLREPDALYEVVQYGPERIDFFNFQLANLQQKT